MADTQAVAATTDAQAKPATEGTDARTADQNLDALLAEFDQSTTRTAQPSTPEPKTDATSTSPDVTQRLAALERTLSEERLQKDMEPVVSKIRSALPSPDMLSDAEIIDLVDGRAKRDQRLVNAWTNRHSNPAAWGKVVDALSRDIAGKFAKLPDKQLTEDRDAVAAAVRGASTQRAPDAKPPKFGSMSNAEFRKTVSDQYGFDPV